MLKIVNTIIASVKSYPAKKKRLPGPLLSMFISNIVSLMIPLLVMKVMDRLKDSEKIDVSSLLFIMFGWLASIILVSVFEHYQRISLKKYDNKVLYSLHSKVIRKKSGHSLFHWLKQNSKEISDEIKKDMEDINSLLPGTIFPLLRSLIMICITFVILMFINLRLTIAVTFLMPLFLLAYLLWDKKTKFLYKATRSSSEKFLSTLIEFLQTIPLMQIFRSTDYEIKNANNSFKNYLDKKIDYFKIINKRRTYSSIVSSFAPIYLAFCAFFFIYYEVATIGEVFAFWGIFSLNLSSVKGVSVAYITLLNSIIVFDKLEQMGTTYTQISKNKKNISSIVKIVGRNLSFKYNDDKYSEILIPDFEIQKGEIVQVTGESGIGKSTFIKLLLGLLQPTKGSLLINNLNIKELDKNQYLNLIGYVEQNGYIYSRSLKENILLGRSFNKNDWERTIHSAQLA
ncbi:MAG: ABC transporter ATP-binding protein, partial [Arcobacter sp.]|nr:ABC transporter ATP-binding protein [Arcobacter sp.]